MSQVVGDGKFPPSVTVGTLTLEKSLNKLKHRDTMKVNFSLPATGGHRLFIFTNGGMGHSDSLSAIDVKNFCDKCKDAAFSL